MSDIKRLDDTLYEIRNLPEEIYEDLGIIIVRRQGETPDAFMKTEGILGYVVPDKIYGMSNEGFHDVADGQKPVKPAENITVPPKVIFTGKQSAQEGVVDLGATVLGRLDILEVTEEALEIPQIEATPSLLAYYGASLIPMGEHFSLDTDAPLPISIMNIGADYLNGYLLSAENGGGAYLEEHDRLHFHMPLSEQERGHLVLAKRNENTWEATAFSIPYGYAIYTPGGVWHDDGFLIGRYLVLYSITDDYTTVLLKTASGGIVQTKVV